MDEIIEVAIYIHGHEYIETAVVDDMIERAVDKALSEYQEKLLDAMESIKVSRP